MKMSKYSSIGQFRNLISTVKNHTAYVGRDENGDAIYNHSKKLPTITFTGYVKLHGTNAGIGFDGENYWAQSRERVITIGDDNAGFAAYSLKHKAKFESILSKIKAETDFDEIVVFGEWCGQGIQKGVGISELEKRYVVFAVGGVYLDEDNESEKTYIDEYVELFNDPEINLFNRSMFKTYSIDIDFAYPEMIVNKIVELTNEVEKECPVAKYFGVENGLGEGIVFEAKLGDSKIQFKSKGEKHSVTKVKTVVQVDPEVVQNIYEFVEYAVTENRLEQGITVLKENNIEIKIENMSHFIKWVSNDVIKEESDVLVANDLTYKQVGGKISQKAKEYFFDVLDKDAGLK